MGLGPSDVNKTHQAYLRDDTLVDRSVSDEKFGEFTVLSLASSIEQMRKAFGPPENVDLVSTIALPAKHPERVALDEHFRAILSRVSDSETKNPSFSLTAGLGSDLTVRINFGLSGIEPNYLMLLGNQGYRVTHDSSQRFMLEPASDIITFELSAATDAEFLRMLPPLAQLKELQVWAGPILRAELGEFPNAVKTRILALMETIWKVAPEAEIPVLVMEVHDPDCPERPVEARFSLDRNCQVQTLQLVR